MDPTRFDAWTTALADAASRRAALKGLAAAGALGALLARLGLGEAAAQEAEVHWDRCRHVGARCRGDGQCCSGRCRGRRRKRCRAHHVGTCRTGQDFCTQGTAAQCNNRNCFCYATTGGARFCGAPSVHCRDCRRDADCEALGFPRGSACVEAVIGSCSCTDFSHSTACIPPCAPPV